LLLIFIFSIYNIIYLSTFSILKEERQQYLILLLLLDMSTIATQQTVKLLATLASQMCTLQNSRDEIALKLI
jgi:asparagine N-glycosylation enzyme membrane subunit Stt3